MRCHLLAALAAAAVGGSVTSLHAKPPAGVTDVDALIELERSIRLRAVRERADAVAWSLQTGRPLRIDHADGGATEIVGLRDGRPITFATDNRNAGDSISTDELLPGGSTGLNLTGSLVALHQWDSGEVRVAHQEFGGRAFWSDINDPGTTRHSTHVAGTMIAAGVSFAARGMAPDALLLAFDWGFDSNEMAGQAASIARVSNHSYGQIRGWRFDAGDWYWYGDPTVSTTQDYRFGFYDSLAQDWDAIAYSAPLYLICISAGNDRGESHSGSHLVFIDGKWVPSTDPRDNDGGVTGYDSVGGRKCAKNVLTVGAVSDIVGGYTGPGSVVMTSFSGWGPTDDGRIKPDIVANGISLFSCDDDSNSDYASLSGTSMASPSVAGSMAPLIELYKSMHDGMEPRAATLKGLVIHTADEAGSWDGPDYRFGWGLVNTLVAAQQIQLDASEPAAIQELTIADGQVFIQSCTAAASGDISVTICWTDPAATPAAASLDPPDLMLVNDLDLRIIGPDETIHEPWILVPGSLGAAALTGDNFRDNVEVVEIAGAPAGQYTLQVTHKGTLVNAEQAFSLIVSGLSCTASASCPWDLDDDGMVGINDFLGLLGQWGSDPGGPPDFDGDGTVGINDFLELLGNWGVCP